MKSLNVEDIWVDASQRIPENNGTKDDFKRKSYEDLKRK